MQIFGYTIIHKKDLQAIEKKAYDKALLHLIEILEESDKVYVSPVEITGPVKLENCVFLGLASSLGRSAAISINEKT